MLVVQTWQTMWIVQNWFISSIDQRSHRVSNNKQQEPMVVVCVKIIMCSVGVYDCYVRNNTSWHTGVGTSLNIFDDKY